MSAWIVSHKHINTLLTYANRHCYPAFHAGTYYDFTQVDQLQAMAELLLAENERSINARYPDTIGHMEDAPGQEDEVGKPITFKFTHNPKHLTPVQVIKSCSCYDYQACETDDYRQTAAAAIVDAIRSTAIGNLPGYDDAEWGID